MITCTTRGVVFDFRAISVRNSGISAIMARVVVVRDVVLRVFLSVGRLFLWYIRSIYFLYIRVYTYGSIIYTGGNDY